MTDLFNQPDPADEQTLRDELTAKWKEKFPTAPEELLEAKINADLYVKSLERQKDEMRADVLRMNEELQARSSMQELLDKMNNPPAQPPAKPEEKSDKVELPDFDKLFEQKYEQKRIQDQETRNFQEVQIKLKERFGNNAGSILQEQAQTLGLSKEDVNSLAKKSPEAFFRLMGLNDQPKDLFMAPPRTNVRNDHYAPKTTKRDWNFYQDMKAKNPKEYWAPKTQLQMHRDAESLGEAFGVD